MVKLNLLDLPGQQQQFTIPETQQATIPEMTHSEMDFSFFEPEEEKSQINLETMAPPHLDPQLQETVPASGSQSVNFIDLEDHDRSEHIANPFNPSGPASRHVFEDEDALSNFESSIDRSGRWKFIGLTLTALLILGMLGYGLYWWLTSDSNISTIDPLTENPIDQLPLENPDPVSAIPDFVANKYAENSSNNAFNVSYAQNYLRAGLPSADYRLLVVTPGYLYMSILGDSRDDIAKFRVNLKETYPNVNLTAESNELRLENGSEKILVDFSAPITDKPSRAITTNQTELVDEDSAVNAIQRIAQQNNLEILYSKRGDDTRSDGMRRTTHYITVSGSEQNVIDFLNNIASNQPAMNIAKAAFYPARGTGRMGGSDINARIDLAFFAAN